MAWTKTYSISTDITSGLLNPSGLHIEVEQIAIPGFIGTRPGGPDEIKLEFLSQLSAPNELLLDSVVAAHMGTTLNDKLHVEEAGSITTTATEYIVVKGLTLTPPMGSYIAWFTGNTTNKSKNKWISLSIYVNGVMAAVSEKSFKQISSSVYPFTCMAHITVDGTQTVEARWKVDTSTGNLYKGRGLYLIQS